MSSEKPPGKVEEVLDAERPVELMLRCSGAEYELVIRQGELEDSLTCQSENLTVMPPIGGAFTGVMFGLYAFGKGEPVLDPADFNSITITH